MSSLLPTEKAAHIHYLKNPQQNQLTGQNFNIYWLIFKLLSKDIHCAQQKTRASDKRALLLSQLSLMTCLENSIELSVSTAGLHLSLKLLCFHWNQGCLTFWLLYCVSDPSVSFLTLYLLFYNIYHEKPQFLFKIKSCLSAEPCSCLHQKEGPWALQTHTQRRR